MQVKVNIELTDQTSEEQLNEKGVTKEFLSRFYYDIFNEMVQSCAHKDLKASVSVTVIDNTKEES